MFLFTFKKENGRARERAKKKSRCFRGFPPNTAITATIRNVAKKANTANIANTTITASIANTTIIASRSKKMKIELLSGIPSKSCHYCHYSQCCQECNAMVNG